MNRKRIALVNLSEGWGGGEVQHLALAEEFIRQGQHSCIITRKGSKLAELAPEKGMSVYCITTGKLSFLNPFKLREVRNLAKQLALDVLILNASQELKLFALAIDKRDHMLIYRRGFHAKVKGAFINRLCIKRLTYLVANSNFIKNTALKEVASYSENPVQVIHNGIISEEYTTPNYSAKRLVAVGRLVAYKQFDVLIQAMVEVVKKIPDAELWIIGEGEEKGNLESLISSLHLENNVVMKGFSREVPKLLSQCSLFVHPAEQEAFGVVFLEAMRQKLASISFTGHAGDEIIIHEKTGWLVEERNPMVLSNAIVKMLSNTERLQVMGEEAFLRFKENFTIEKAVKKYLKLIG